jgi:membrane associated rhomboid family serine protease
MAPRINIPPITRALLVLLVTFSLLNAFARYHAWQENNKSSSLIDRAHVAPYLTLVPGASLPKYPWVLLTATLIEQNIAGLLITGASLFYGGRYLERAWGSNEYLKFVGIAAVVPNVLSWLIYITTHLLTGNEGAS